MNGTMDGQMSVRMDGLLIKTWTKKYLARLNYYS